MKVLALLARAALGLGAAFIASYAAARAFLNYSAYESRLDRAFLLAVPTLALGAVLFVLIPPLWDWLRQRQPAVLFGIGAAALAAALAVALPQVVSFDGLVGLAVTGAAIFALMAPAADSVERIHVGFSLRSYALGSLCSSALACGAVGFLHAPLGSTLHMVIFTVVLIVPGSALGYYVVLGASRSLQDGFLRRPLNLFLGITLPVLLAALTLMSARFPAMFSWEDISIPSAWVGPFAASAVVAGVWGVAALEQFESRGLREKFRASLLWARLRDHQPGLYAAGMFFLIHLILVLALNHPALSLNSVVFESDAGPWMSILGSPRGEAVNRAVHPLLLITARPLVRLLGGFMGEHWQLAPMLVVAAASGACVFMAWVFVKRAAGDATYAFIFAILLGSTATHLLFGSLVETFAFAMASLILFYLLVQAAERRFAVLVPAGLMVFGITVSNFAQPVIGLLFSGFGLRRLVSYCLFVLTAGVVLTALTGALYPSWQTLFFVPSDAAFETHFVKPVYAAPAAQLRHKVELAGRTMLLYGVVGPSPVEVIAHKAPRPTIDLKTFDARSGLYASYKGLANIPLAMWLMVLGGSLVLFVREFRSTRHLGLMLGLLGSLAFNFFLHLNYGTELLLYTPYWTYAVIFFVALAYAGLAGRKWIEYSLAGFVLALMINNTWFIYATLRSLAPFFAAS